MKIISVVGARPNFMKIAPFIRAIEKINKENEKRSNEIIEHILVHTGQHYDVRMSESFFESLDIPNPDINLEIGSGSHAEQVGHTMIAFEKVLEKEKPDWVVVLGDVNATLACSVAAKKLHVKVCHIEAGLRSGDERMPEEINRLVTDRLSDLLLTPDTLSNENLRKEGVPQHKIQFVGNIMIDTLEANREKAAQLEIDDIIERNLINGQAIEKGKGKKENSVTSVFQDTSTDGELKDVANPENEANRDENQQSTTENQQPKTDNRQTTTERFALMTMHRPSNVDEKQTFEPIMRFLLDEVTRDMPILWPIHPRSQKQLKTFGLWEEVLANENLVLLHPIGYHDMLRLNMDAKIMFTDSGGLQEECTVLGTPCLTLRWNTERPVTLREHGGASVLVGNNVARIRKEYHSTLALERKPQRPELWDGHTAMRCVEAIINVVVPSPADSKSAG
jgi:UDP-N-acetylglucosamine 2-epimerase (non-hydrolysing)